MPAFRIRSALALLLLPLLGLAACGSTSKDAARGGSVVGDSLTVYSGLPLRDRPRDVDALRSIGGVGTAKLARYGDAFLHALNEGTQA